jgi:hypothetical protein
VRRPPAGAPPRAPPPPATLADTPSFARAHLCFPPAAADQLGAGFYLVRADVGGNIERLAARAAADAPRYAGDLFAIVRDEVAEGAVAGSASCARGLLWLKRAMEFLSTLIRRLAGDADASLAAAASEAYCATLQRYHGWLVTGTFTVALKLVPARGAFMARVAAMPGGGAGAGEGGGAAEMAAYCDALDAALAEVHAFLAGEGLDDPSKV